MSTLPSGWAWLRGSPTAKPGYVAGTDETQALVAEPEFIRQHDMATTILVDRSDAKALSNVAVQAMLQAIFENAYMHIGNI